MYQSSTMPRRTGRLLVIFALFELALAAGFWFLVGDEPRDGGGMRLTAILLGGVGVILLLVGLFSMRRAAKKDRVSMSGVAGTGEIVALTQTGVYMNDQPQVQLDLLVTIPGRSPYRVKVKEIVPLIMLGRLQGTLPVRVDPAEPETVVIQWDQSNVGSGPGGLDPSAFVVGGPGTRVLWSAGSDAGAASGMGASAPMSPETLGQVNAAIAAAMAAVGGGAAPVATPAGPPGADGSAGWAAQPGQPWQPGQPGQAGYTIEELRTYLRSNGLSGTARIDRLDDSGQTVGDERLFTMVTTVSIPGRAPFAIGPTAAMVPLEKVGRVAVGVALPVLVAPDNQNMMMVEWERV